MATLTAPPRTTAGADVLEEKRKLKKSLFRWDLALFSICAVVGIDTLGQAASFGTQTLFWLVFLSVFFMIPYGLIIAELGTNIPVEGAVYEWVRLAYGHLAGAVTAVVYWIANPVWLGGTLAVTAIAAMDTLWGTKIGGNTGLAIVVGLAFVWVGISMNILSLRYMKWVPALGTVVRVVLLLLFGLLVVGSIAAGKNAGSINAKDLFPTAAVFVGVLGVLIFNFVGFEVQSNASEEMGDPRRDVPRSIAVTWLFGLAFYLIPVAGILLVVSGKNITNVGGFVSGYQTVVSNVFGGSAANVLNGIVGAAVVFSLLGSGVVWLMGSDRALAISSLAGSGPRPLGHFSKRFGTPVPVNVLSGIMASIILVLSFLLTSGDLQSFFKTVLALTISTTTFSYIAVFPAIITLRRKYGTTGGGYRIPGGAPMVWLCAILAEFFVLAATVFSLWPNLCSANGCFTGDATAVVGNVARGTWELWTIGAMVVIVLLGVVFWWSGRNHRASAESELTTAMVEPSLKA
ncbi:MAG: APC family permease [Candidatus Dormibacteraeota bacterium]|nr:APC family permease [Candidatus Dormibacteraeota bacterium]